MKMAKIKGWKKIKSTKNEEKWFNKKRGEYVSIFNQGDYWDLMVKDRYGSSALIEYAKIQDLKNLTKDYVKSKAIKYMKNNPW